MNTELKILLIGILFAAVLSREKMVDYLDLRQAKLPADATATKSDVEQAKKQIWKTANFVRGDLSDGWEKASSGWMLDKQPPVPRMQPVFQSKVTYSATEPIKVGWKELVKVRYRLRYSEKQDMEVYVPVFPESIKALNGKQVIIEGYIIPLDEKQELLVLSANPYASCFFCGQGNPASVMSLYLKKKRKRYKIDDFKKFSGTLHLNYDDPNEFYYILRDAEEE